MHKEEKTWPNAKTSLLQAHNAFWHCLRKLSLNFSFQAVTEQFSVCIQHSNPSSHNTAPSVMSLLGTYLDVDLLFSFYGSVIITPSCSHFYLLFMLHLFFCLLAVRGNTVQNLYHRTQLIYCCVNHNTEREQLPSLLPNMQQEPHSAMLYLMSSCKHFGCSCT